MTLSCTSRTIPSNTWINELDTTTFSYDTHNVVDNINAYYDGTPACAAYNISHSETTSIDSILTPITITDDKVSLTEIPNLTVKSYGQSANDSPNFEGSFTVPYITVDKYGRITAIANKTIYLITIFISILYIFIGNRFFTKDIRLSISSRCCSSISPRTSNSISAFVISIPPF